MNRASENGPQASLRAAGTHDGQEVSCVCGATRFICTGKPIIVTECHCDSCRKAGAILEALPGAPTVLEPSSGTRFVVHRKDRISRCRAPNIFATCVA